MKITTKGFDELLNKLDQLIDAYENMDQKTIDLRQEVVLENDVLYVDEKGASQFAKNGKFVNWLKNNSSEANEKLR